MFPTKNLIMQRFWMIMVCFCKDFIFTVHETNFMVKKSNRPSNVFEVYVKEIFIFM